MYLVVLYLLGLVKKIKVCSTARKVIFESKVQMLRFFKKMSRSSSSRNFVDITKNPNYSRLSPFLCVVSNSKNDFVCHQLFIKAASSYFSDLFIYQKEDYEIEPGKVVPRLVLVSEFWFAPMF